MRVPLHIRVEGVGYLMMWVRFGNCVGLVRCDLVHQADVVDHSNTGFE